MKQSLANLQPRKEAVLIAGIVTALRIQSSKRGKMAFVTLDDGQVDGGPARGGSKVTLEGRRLLNPGSVGQPRDGDPRAAWMLLDLEERFAEFRRVPYSIERTQAEMRERGLPQALAVRLERGE